MSLDGYCRKLLTFCTLQTALVDRPMSRGVGGGFPRCVTPNTTVTGRKIKQPHEYLTTAAVRCSVFCSKRCALCRVATHGQNDNCVQFKGRLTHCPRCGHVTHRNQQVAISIHNAVLEYGVASGERPAYLKPEDSAAWQWQVSEVRAGR